MAKQTLRTWIVPLYLLAQSSGSGLLILPSAVLLFGETAPGTMPLLAGGLGALAVLIVALGAYLFAMRWLVPPFHSQPTYADSNWALYSWCSSVSLAMLAGAWWVLEYAANASWLGADMFETVRDPLLWLILLGAFVTALLFAFLLGHDPACAMWRSTLLPPHLTLRAVLAGSSAWLMLGAFIPLADPLAQIAPLVFTLALLANLLCILGEFGMMRTDATATAAIRQITRGVHRDLFWWGALGLGHVAPLGLLLLDHPLLRAQAGLYALVGLFCYEYVYIVAPRRVALAANQPERAARPNALVENKGQP